MSSTNDPDLEGIFEEILSEIKVGERDEAAMLQAIALSNNDLNEIRKNYLLIRANKIHKSELEKKQKKKQKKKQDQEKLRTLIALGFFLLLSFLILFLMTDF